MGSEKVGLLDKTEQRVAEERKAADEQKTDDEQYNNMDELIYSQRQQNNNMNELILWLKIGLVSITLSLLLIALMVRRIPFAM